MSESADGRIEELNSEWEQHHHNHHQLILGLSGRIRVKLSQQQTIILESNHACLIPSGCFHSFQGMGNNRVLVIDIDPSDNSIDSSVMQFIFQQAQYLLLDSQLVKLISALSDELALQNNAALQPHVISLILFSLQHRLQQPEPQLAKDSRLNIKGLNEFILQNLAEKMSVGQLATFCHMSSSQFHLRFRQLKGLTPHQYIVQQRTEQAIWLLRNSDLTIAQIAADTGFTNQSALNHVVKAKLNTSPGQIRKERHSLSIQSF
jgi:AraC-like DNA-binding protein